MADQPVVHKVLAELAAALKKEPAAAGSGRDLGLEPGVEEVCRGIAASFQEYVAGQTEATLEEQDAASRQTSPDFRAGDAAGRILAGKFSDSAVSVQVFFEAQARARNYLLNRLCDKFSDPARLCQALHVLEFFFDGLASGFAEDRIRAVKATARRRHQEAKRYILLEKKRYLTVFAQMNEPAFVVDEQLRLVDVNPAFEQFFRMSGSELTGLNCCEIIGREFCTKCPLEEVVKNGGSFSNLELTIPAPGAEAQSGEMKTILLAGTALGDLDGTRRGGIVLVQDITERKNIELELEEYRDWLEDFVDERTEELLAANERLELEIRERRQVENELVQATASLQSSNADLEQFAHVASHDLREPLMLVASFAERLLVRYGESLDERGRGYLDRIIMAVRKLQDLIDALLQLSKVSTSTRGFEKLDLNELVQEVLGDLEDAISRSGARLEIGSLPSLSGDGIQIRQLFQNLISNALKYHRPNQAPLVSISSRVSDDFCEIVIEDQGIGFNHGDVERIFEPFVRLHGSDVYNGSGMGLTTCKKIVTRHGGEILARGGPDYGAVFVVRLPISQNHDRDPV